MFQKTSAVGARIRAERRRAGLSQDGLAAQLHVTRQTISNWEVGKSLPDIESLKALAKALSVPIERLIYAKPPGAVENSFSTVVAEALPLELWCRRLGIFVLVLGLLWGLIAGSGAVQAADGGVGFGFSWREAVSVWYTALIRGTLLLGISRILTILKEKGP